MKNQRIFLTLQFFNFNQFLSKYYFKKYKKNTQLNLYLIFQQLTSMIKESITQYFDHFEANQITNIPQFQFKPNRNPFDFLPPQKIIFNDMRAILKPKQSTVQQSSQNLIETIKRYTNQFKFRNSSQIRILTHTIEYTVFYGLVIFGFYSRQFSGFKRFQHIIKQTAKNAIYAGSIFTANQLFYTFIYKSMYQLKQKPVFSIGNILSAFIVWPLALFLESNFLMSIRKVLFICAFAQLRDFQNQNQRFYKLNPDHIASKAKIQGQRIKHPFQNPYKKLLSSNNSRAQQQRRNQQRNQLQKKALSLNKDQKIPSSYLYMIMPEIYRPPTEEEKLRHQIKASQKTKQLLEQRGIEWITIQAPDQSPTKKQKKKEKSFWWPF